MSNLPKSVVYSFREATLTPIKFKDDDEFGNYENDKININIAIDVPSNEQGNTFLHEYFHFVCSTLKPFEGLPKADAVEERAVRVFAGAVSELLTRNPEAFKWMTEKMQGR